MHEDETGDGTSLNNNLLHEYGHSRSVGRSAAQSLLVLNWLDGDYDDGDGDATSYALARMPYHGWTRA